MQNNSNPFLPFEEEILIESKITPLPMQYLGAKTRITDWIQSAIKNKFSHEDRFFDLMSGTGSVAIAAKHIGYKIIANDVQPYSYVVLKSLFKEDRLGVKELSEDILKVKDLRILLNNARGKNENLLRREDDFESNQHKFTDIWQDYQFFCENTPYIKQIEDIQTIRLKNEWNLFTNYYANTYFGVKQCLELDAIREFAETLPENLKIHLIAATISVMTFTVSSTTHLAQYLKPNSLNNSLKLIKRRRIGIIDEVSKRLKNLVNFTLPIKPAVITNLDYKTALETIKINEKYIVYVDPPYFKEHYSRYYHVLDTFYLYDYPALTPNARLGDVTVGRYRENRIISDFGLKSKVKEAFKYIFTSCSKHHTSIVISYASTSLITKEDIINISREFNYKCDILEKELMHSAQGQPKNKKVIEYLFLFKYE